jgi:hypothetical protein
MFATHCRPSRTWVRRCLQSGSSGFTFLLHLIVGVVVDTSSRHLSFISGADPSLFSFLLSFGFPRPRFPFGERKTLLVTSSVDLCYALLSL